MKKFQVLSMAFIVVMATTGAFTINAFLKDAPVVVHIPMIIGSIDMQNTNLEATKISEIADKIRNAKEGQDVLIHINSYGGVVFNALEIMNAMKETKGHTIAVLDGAVISAGSMIALSAQEIQVSANSMVLIHLASGGDPSGPMLMWMNFRILLPLITGILTPQEINGVFAGQQWIADGSVLKDRFDRLHGTGTYEKSFEDNLLGFVRYIIIGEPAPANRLANK